MIRQLFAFLQSNKRVRARARPAPPRGSPATRNDPHVRPDLGGGCCGCGCGCCCCTCAWSCARARCHARCSRKAIETPRLGGDGSGRDGRDGDADGPGVAAAAAAAAVHLPGIPSARNASRFALARAQTSEGEGRAGGLVRGARTGIRMQPDPCAVKPDPPTICAKTRSRVSMCVSEQAGLGKGGKAGVGWVMAVRTFVQRIERPPRAARVRGRSPAAIAPARGRLGGHGGNQLRVPMELRANSSRRASCRRPQTRRQRTHALCVCCRQVGTELPPPQRAQEVHAERGRGSARVESL